MKEIKKQLNEFIKENYVRYYWKIHELFYSNDYDEMIDDNENHIWFIDQLQDVNFNEFIKSIPEVKEWFRLWLLDDVSSDGASILKIENNKYTLHQDYDIKLFKIKPSTQDLKTINDFLKKDNIIVKNYILSLWFLEYLVFYEDDVLFNWLINRF